MNIFVFGSNREGRHRRGAAKFAYNNRGAKYYQPEGLQGKSYAIITKELRKHCQPVTLDEIASGVERFINFARNNPEVTFTVTPIGCGLAGFNPYQIGPLFRCAPPNVTLPPEFTHAINFTA